MEKLEYMPTECKESEDFKIRYYLEQKGDKMLFIVGLNPSYANMDRPDSTMKKILGFMKREGYNGFVMLNLYAQRGAFPKEQDKTEHQKVLNYIRILLSKYPELNILLAFGNNITLRDYLGRNLLDILEILGDKKYFQIGDLTKEGYPRHPSRAKYEDFQLCDIEKLKEKVTKN